MSRLCKNHPDKFCYICGELTLAKDRRQITDLTKTLYNKYFKCPIGDQNKTWAPHIICNKCYRTLTNWNQGTGPGFSFGIPMIWREQKYRTTDCYFCMTDILN